ALALAAWAALAAGMPAPGAAAVRPSVTAKPRLSPAFRAGVRDYTSRCRPGRPLRLSIVAPRGVAVGVDGARARSGRFSTRVRLRADQSTQLVVRSRGRSRRHHIRCLPRHFPHWSFRRFGRPRVGLILIAPVGSPKKYAASSHYLAVVHRHGVPVWW